MTNDGAGSLLFRLNEQLAMVGMEILGSFRVRRDEINFSEDEEFFLGIMVASTKRMWPHFRGSSQFCDGISDPLERWSRQVLGEVAGKFGARLVLPFERPFAPFQTWAKRATGMKQTPLGLLIHRQYGLWFALRGVLFLSVNVKNQQLHKLIQATGDVVHLCESCEGKPCLSACPVDAFQEGRLDTDACFSHIDLSAAPDCGKHGCAARAACPGGEGYEYCPEQVRFHMAAFRKGP